MTNTISSTSNCIASATTRNTLSGLAWNAVTFPILCMTSTRWSIPGAGTQRHLSPRLARAQLPLHRPLRQSFTRIASTAQLTRALLPAQELGPGAAVRNSGTDLADVVALCGDPLPGGARLTAYETLQDGQTGQFLEEFIIEWDNPGDAAVLIRNDHAALDKTGSCSYGSGEQRLEFAGDEPGSVPQECGNGQYVATQVSYPSVPLPGFHASAQCGLYTISVTIFGRAGPAVNHETADGYLNSAVGRLQKNLG